MKKPLSNVGRPFGRKSLRRGEVLGAARLGRAFLARLPLAPLAHGTQEPMVHFMVAS